MLDALFVGGNPPSGGTERVTTALPPCPPWLTPVRDLMHARAASPRNHGTVGAPRTSVARAEGKRFERKVLVGLAERFPFLQIEPGFAFHDAFGARMCYPDALLRFNDSTVIVEIKHRGHALGDAWWQLERYYRPVVEAVFPADPVQTLAIVHRVDPSVRVPAATAVDWASFSAWRADVANRFGVMEWRSA